MSELEKEEVREAFVLLIVNEWDRLDLEIQEF